MVTEVKADIPLRHLNCWEVKETLQAYSLLRGKAHLRSESIQRAAPPPAICHRPSAISSLWAFGAQKVALFADVHSVSYVQGAPVPVQGRGGPSEKAGSHPCTGSPAVVSSTDLETAPDP